MRFLLLIVLCYGCSYTVRPADLPPSFYGIDTAELIENQQTASLGLELELLQSEDVFALDVQPGVSVKRVADKSPARLAGIMSGDILLSYDKHPTDDPQRVAALLENESDVRVVELEIQRGTEVLVASVELAMKTTGALRSKYFVERGLLRAAFSDTAEGLPRIEMLDEQSPLTAAGAQVGDVVLRYQNSNTASSHELVRRIRLGLAPADAVTMLLLRADGTQHTVRCEAWSPETFVTEVGLWPIFYWERTPGEGKGMFTFGNFIISNIFSYERDGREKEFSILGLFDWKTGELILEEE
ncbi:MAG: C-terminal processing protease CtpA/Prc [Myxococcota bacterium]|jgi:C-terminal processing protease CtpA/Prc